MTITDTTNVRKWNHQLIERELLLQKVMQSYAIAKTKLVVIILSVANRIQRDRQPYTETNAPLTMTGKCSIRSSTNIHFLSKFYV